MSNNKRLGTLSNIVIWIGSLLWLIGNKLSGEAAYNANPTFGSIVTIAFLGTTAWFTYKLFKWMSKGMFRG